jgi:hypothetical protein
MPSVTSYCVWKYSEEDLDAAEGYDKDTEDEAQQLARDIIAQASLLTWWPSRRSAPGTPMTATYCSASTATSKSQ